jgi:hypothetical protein
MDRRDAIKALFGVPVTTQISRIPASELKPTDVIVIEAPGELTPEIAEKLQRHAQKVWPNHRIVVMAGGLHVKILSSVAPLIERL